MFFQFNDEPVGISLDQLNENILTAGYINIAELEGIYKNMGFYAKSVEKCKEGNGIFISDMDIYDSYTFIKIVTDDIELSDASQNTLAVFIKRNLLLVIDSGKSGRDRFMDIVSRCSCESISLEKLTCTLLERLIQGSSKELSKKELQINSLEEIVLNNKADKNFNLTLLNMKKELLKLRSFYEQLIDIGDTLRENENEMFDSSSLTCFKIFTEKTVRLKENVDILRDSVVHLWDSYQAYLDMKLNETMKIFTLMTTIFFPLTVIVGWYGMNFKYMPELTSEWGYPFVIILSISVIGALIIWFKIKKWI